MDPVTIAPRLFCKCHLAECTAPFDNFARHGTLQRLCVSAQTLNKRVDQRDAIDDFAGVQVFTVQNVTAGNARGLYDQCVVE